MISEILTTKKKKSAVDILCAVKISCAAYSLYSQGLYSSLGKLDQRVKSINESSR